MTCAGLLSWTAAPALLIPNAHDRIGQKLGIVTSVFALIAKQGRGEQLCTQSFELGPVDHQDIRSLSEILCLQMLRHRTVVGKAAIYDPRAAVPQQLPQMV
jgi:hypothetical protein